MFDFFTLKPAAFGMDVSDLSLKIIKLKKAGKFSGKSDFLGLASFGETLIKPGIIEQGEIKDEEALAKILKEAVSNVKGERLKTKYLVASLPEEKAFLQVIQLPLMEKEEIKKAVYYEAENYVPLPIKEVYLDCQIATPVHDNFDHFDVLIAALPKKTVDPYVTSFKKAGLLPLALEIESQAISRALIKEGISPVPVLLIDLGANRTSFSIFSGSSLRFTTTLPISSRQFTDLISKTLKIELKEAEELKIKYGILEKGKGKLISEALLPILTELVSQIKKYISFYQTHRGHEHLRPNDKKLEKIILCGGGANLKGLCDFLSLELKIEVEFGNPWINILPKPLKEVPQLSYEESLRHTTALGLGLRGINL